MLKAIPATKRKSLPGFRKQARSLILSTLLISLLISYAQHTEAQVSNYIFTQSAGSYTPGVSATSSTPADILNPLWDDTTYRLYTLPFAFTYNGVLYAPGAGVGIDSDGWIAFSNSSPVNMTGTFAGGSFATITDPTGVYLSGTANNNGVGGFNADLGTQFFPTINGTLTTGSALITGVSSFTNIQVGTRLEGTGIANGTVVASFNIGASTITMSSNASTTGSSSITPRSSVYAFTTGTAPNRKFVVQWTQVKRNLIVSGESISFQIILSEGGGNAALQTVQVVYGTCNTVSTTVLNVQVGLRGATAADFNARTTSTDWTATTAATANTDVLSFININTPPAGLTYTWSPCITGPGAAGVITGPAAVCEATAIQYTLATVPQASFYTWSYSGTGATFNTVTVSAANTIAFAQGATSGTLTVTPGNLCGNGTANSIAITVNSIPSAAIAYPAASYCKSTAGAIAVSQTGTSGGTYSVSGPGLSINISNGTITPSASTAGSYTITYTFSNGTCTNTAVTNISIYDLPTAAITASPAIFCSGENSQLQALSGAIGTNYSVQALNYTNVVPSGLATTVWNTYTDEGVSAAISLPFTFNYYGSPVSQLFIHTNGYVQMQTLTASSNAPQTLPNTLTPNNVVSLAWQNLIVDPSINTGANVRYFVNGISPNRVMVIEFTGLSFYKLPANVGNVTGQIRLFESDSHIEIAATSVSDAGNAFDKTMGIENSTGTLAVTPASRNKAAWNIAAPEAWAFYPPVGGTLTYLWTPATFLSNTTIANPVATAVTATTAYNVTITNTGTGCLNNAAATITVSAPLNGTYTVGASGNFATLTAAVSAYNSVCITGPVTFLLTDASYNAGETFPLIINRNSYASAVNTLTIKPATGVTTAITGVANNDALIRILGSYVTIDGSNNGTSGRNLTITNTGFSSARAILFGSTGTTPIVFSGIRNSIISAGTTFSNAIVISDASTFNAIGYFNNISIENNSIRRAFYGIYCNAAVVAGNGSGLAIQSNDMAATGANALQLTGIFVQGVDGATIKSNQIGNFIGSDDAVDRGIWLGNGVKNTAVINNTIANLNYTGTNGYGGQGIFIATNINGNDILVAGNMIANISGDGNDYTNGTVTQNNPSGILLAGTQSGIRIYHNSIYLGGATGFTNTLNKANALSACIRIQGAGIAEIRNNIMVNQLGLSASLGLGAIGLMASTGSNQFASLDHNNYVINPAGSGIKAFGMIGGVAQSTLAAWKTATGKDAASLSIAPVFVSATDLHLVPALNLSLNNSAAAIAGYSGNDIDNATLNGLTPDMGCDEFVAPNTASWVGKTSTSWLSASNWEANVVPDGNTDVTITGGYTFMPRITGTQAVRAIDISAPGIPPLLTVDEGAVMQINGTITRTGGSIEASAGTIEFNGTAAQTIPAGLLLANKIRNMVIGNSSAAGVTLAGMVDVYRSVTFSAPGIKLSTGDFLTLKSTATGTAWLGNVTGKTITGNATVERFIPTGITHGKSWQFLAVPLNGPQTINQAWQDTATAPNQSRYNGYGIQITSNISPLPPMFDVFTPAGPTMKTYNPLTNNWDGVANTTSQPIANKKGYLVFVRGDRTVITASAAAVPTVLRAKGKLYTATAGELPPVTTILPDKFESIGNPYAAAIDFEKINKPGSPFVDDAFYVWDPLLPGTRGLGGYQTISSANGFYPVPGGTANYCGCEPITRIQSGQAFLMHATGPGSGGPVSFTEAAKDTGSALVYRNTHRLENRQFLRAYLFTGAGTDSKIADGNVVAFDQDYSNQYNSDDALKIANGGENFGISNNGNLLSIEARNAALSAADTIFYNLTNLRKQTYQFRFKPVNMGSASASAWLVDRYLQTETPVNLTDSTFIDFTITDDAASAAANRFYLVFRPVVVLPVTITSLSAIRNGNEAVDIKWKVQNETNLEGYFVERSADGRNFSSLFQTLPIVNNGGDAVYTFEDKTPIKAYCFYRIKAISNNGLVQYSNIVKLGPVVATAGISIYPNPVIGKTAHIRFENQPQGLIRLQLINEIGQVVYNGSLQTDTSSSKQVFFGNHINSGTYQLKVIFQDNRSVVQKIFIQ